MEKEEGEKEGKEGVGKISQHPPPTSMSMKQGMNSASLEKGKKVEFTQ